MSGSFPSHPQFTPLPLIPQSVGTANTDIYNIAVITIPIRVIYVEVRLKCTESVSKLCREIGEERVGKLAIITSNGLLAAALVL